jgi:hypothetical protein
MRLNRLMIVVTILMLSNNFVNAQDQIAGVYKLSSGNPEGGNTFFIFNDHRFVVTFFGGVLVGTWSIQDKQVNFKPFVSEHQFYIYGRHNSDLKNGSRIYFQGFQEEPTFIGFGKMQLDQPLLKSVFNPNPNCVSYPSVAKFNEVPTQILLSNQSDYQSNQGLKRNVYTFSNTEKYNDFIAYYQEDSQDKKPFSATLKGGKLFFGYDEKGAVKYPLPTKGEDFQFIKQILEAPTSVDKVFYNPFYNQSNENLNDKYNWKFDERKNAYINIHNYVNGEENRPKEQDAYNKMNIIYQFNLLKLVEKKVKPFAIDRKSLFVAICKDN